MPQHHPEDPTSGEKKRLFLDQFERVGTMTAGCRNAHTSFRTLHKWLAEDRNFREAFNEAKLRFRDHIEEKIMERIEKGDNGGLLKFKAQAELLEKYGKPGKTSSPPGHSGLSLDDLEKLAREANDQSTG